MAINYFTSAAGAGSHDGLTVVDAWAFSEVNEALIDADSENVLYILDASAIDFPVQTVTSTGYIHDGGYTGHECSFDVTSDSYCMSVNAKTYDSTAPLQIRNITMTGATTSELWLYSSDYINITNVDCVSDGATTIAINVQASDNVSFDNFSASGYSVRGIDLRGEAAVTNTGFTISNSETSSCDKGLHIRTVNAASVINDINITNHTANNCGNAGISLFAGANSEISGAVIQNSTTNSNGSTLWGTGIETSGQDATGVMHDITIRFCTANNNIDADADGNDGVGIRFDDWVYDSVAYCNTCDGNVTGMVLKHSNNTIYSNLVTNSTTFGVRYAANVGGVSISGYIRNMTIVNSVDGYSNLNPAADGGVLMNSIIVDGTNGIVSHSGATFTENNNCLFNNSNENYIDDSGTPIAVDSTDITADPLFVDAENGDYNLQQSSPCVGVGTKWWGLNPRPESLSGEPLPDRDIDIGAYQSTHSPLHPKNI